MGKKTFEITKVLADTSCQGCSTKPKFIYKVGMAGFECRFCWVCLQKLKKDIAKEIDITPRVMTQEYLELRLDHSQKKRLDLGMNATLEINAPVALQQLVYETEIGVFRGLIEELQRETS